MKVRAKNWVKYNGTFYAAGEKFEVATTDLDAVKQYVEIVETPLDETPRRGRKPTEK